MKKTYITTKVLTLLLLVSTIGVFAQQTEKCATDALSALERQKNPVMFDQNRARLEAFTKVYAQKKNKTYRESNSVTKIPTVVHIVHNGEAVGTYPNISDAQINSAITNLNHAYQNSSIYGGSTFYNSPMNIEFVLAKVKEDGTATTGIERHDVTGKSYDAEYNNNGISAGGVGVSSSDLFKDFYWNPQDYMNIWVVKKIDGVDTGTGASGILGYATLPTTFNGMSDGLVCQAHAFGYNPAYNSSNPSATPGFDFGTTSSPRSKNGTVNHEVGHYLNLYHTFTGDNDGTACPPSSGIVGTDDDGCADIPPHKRTQSVCPSDSSTGNSCTGDSNDYIHNFMDYSSDSCFTGFSNDQRTRVHAAIDGPRSAFKTSIGATAPSGNYPAALTNTPVVQNINVESNLGVYEVTLNGTTFNSLGSRNDGGYLNRVASQSAITLVENTSYTMTVKVGVDNNIYSELVDAYIDYNNDGTFAASERIHQTTAGNGKINGAAFSINFTTPTSGGFVDNQKLRMRIISDYDLGSNISNAYTSQYGNIEDYSVIFNPTASLQENEIGSIRIYPNPAKDIINIKNTSNKDIKTVTIFDTLGRRAYSNSSTDKIPLNNLENGVYFLKLDFINSNSVVKRFIKE